MPVLSRLSLARSAMNGVPDVCSRVGALRGSSRSMARWHWTRTQGLANRYLRMYISTVFFLPKRLWLGRKEARKPDPCIWWPGLIRSQSEMRSCNLQRRSWQCSYSAFRWGHFVVGFQPGMNLNSLDTIEIGDVEMAAKIYAHNRYLADELKCLFER